MTDARLVRAEVLANQGELSGAEALLSELVRKREGGFAAQYLLSSVLILQRRYADAEPILDRLAVQAPGNVDVLNSLGVIALEHQQDWAHAEQLFAQAVRAQPGNVLALGNLGNAYFKQSRFDEAEESYRKVISIDKNNVNALNNLGALAKRRADFDGALRWYRAAYARAPKDPNVLRNLLITYYYSVGNDHESIRLIHEILALPAPGIALLAVYPLVKLYCMWDVEDRIRDEVIGMALRGQADALGMEMTLLNAMTNPDIPLPVQFQLHKMLAQKLRDQMQGMPYASYRPAGHKLRIGYFSGDFRAHSVHKFLREIVGRYDRSRFDVYCYSTVNPQAYDEVTREYQRAVDAFVDVSALSVQDIAHRIHADDINILVNLTGYTGGARMGLTCYRPAPVQMTYLGYPYTSGMEEMDFMISDPCLDAADNARLFTEKFLVLPRVFVSHEYADVPGRTAGGPQARNGYVTFGSLNNPYKLNRQVIQAWAAILKRVPGSRLVLNNPKLKTPENQANITAEFVRAGVEPERIAYVWQSHASGNHLHFYNDIDIALDTFPLTGGTTTVDSVLMGVPVVTLVGSVYYQRLSYAILSGCDIDLSDLAAQSVDDYVNKAVALALAPECLLALRKSLLDRVPASPLCDTEGFARAMEQAYLAAWQAKGTRMPPEIGSVLEAIANLSRRGYVIAVHGRLASVEAAIGGNADGAAADSADLLVSADGYPGEGRRWWRYVPVIQRFVPIGAAAGGLAIGATPAAEERLKADGLLLGETDSTEVPLTAEPAGWLAWLAARGAFVPGLVPAWVETMRAHTEWEVYSAALNCCAAAADSKDAPALRVAQLGRSNELLLLLAQNAPTPARLASLLQVSLQLGLWNQASAVSDYLAEFLDAAPYAPDEPVLPPGQGAEPWGPAQIQERVAAAVNDAKQGLAYVLGTMPGEKNPG